MFDLGRVVGAVAAAFALGIVGYIVSMPFTKSLSARYSVAIGMVGALVLLPGVVFFNPFTVVGSLMASALLYWRYRAAAKRSSLPDQAID